MDPVERALAEQEARRSSLKVPLIAAAATFGGGLLLARLAPSPPPPASVSREAPAPVPVAPVEVSRVEPDPAGAHALPTGRFGEESYEPPARGLGEVSARPARPRKTAPARERVGVGAVAPAPPPSAPPAPAGPARPALENRLSDASKSGGFVPVAAMSAGAPAAEEESEDAATRAARNPVAYDREEREAAIRALKALLGKDGRMQAVKVDKVELYQAQQAVEAALEQNHSNLKDGEGAAAKKPFKLPDAVQPGKVVLPENLPKELERLRDQFGKRK